MYFYQMYWSESQIKLILLVISDEIDHKIILARYNTSRINVTYKSQIKFNNIAW